jgi:NADH dehydrogenase
MEEKETEEHTSPTFPKGETFGSLEVVVPPESEIPPLPPESFSVSGEQTGSGLTTGDAGTNDGPVIKSLQEEDGNLVESAPQQTFSSRTRILVLGAGFGGTAAAKRLASKFRRAEIIIVDRLNHFLFTPMMHEVASGVLSAGSVMVPISDATSGKTKFVQGEVVSINFSGKKVKVVSGGFEQELAYDYLIIALGGTTNFFDTPGARENCLQLKTAEDARRIRERIVSMLRPVQSDSRSDASAKLRLVIVGGGPSGIELAGEVAHVMSEASKKSGTRIGEVVLLEAMERLLPNSDPLIGDLARKKLEKIGVKVRTGAKVTSVTADSIELNGEEIIEADAVVWVAGVSGIDVKTFPEVIRDNRLRFVVGNTLQIAGYPEAFAIGDCAVVEGKQYPPTARVALQQARLVADNIHKLASKISLKNFEYRHPGDLMTVGPWYAVMKFGNFTFHGTWVWVIWRLVYLSKIAGMKTKLSVLHDWFFSRSYKI